MRALEKNEKNHDKNEETNDDLSTNTDIHITDVNTDIDTDKYSLTEQNILFQLEELLVNKTEKIDNNDDNLVFNNNNNNNNNMNDNVNNYNNNDGNNGENVEYNSILMIIKNILNDIDIQDKSKILLEFAIQGMYIYVCVCI
jgi:hypothetical protein